jgi:hypothetical protein
MRVALIGTCVFGLAALPTGARASGVAVYVGYADNLRPNPFFPSPWDGSPNTIFLGSMTPGTIFDAGAILIWNTSGSTIMVNDLFVSGFDNGATFDLWGKPGALPSNSFMILTQTTTNDSQFDTSDQLRGFTYPDVNPGSGFTPANPYTGDPQVRVTINGTATTFSDTGHVLDTGGYDAATFGINGSNFPYNPNKFPENESLQWRPIGTTGVGNPGGNPPSIPEPSTLILSALGLVCLVALYGRRRRKSQLLALKSVEAQLTR